MDKNDIYNQVNDKRNRGNLPPISKEEFVAALSSLEAKGVIMTLDNECWVKAPDVEIEPEIITGG